MSFGNASDKVTAFMGSALLQDYVVRRRDRIRDLGPRQLVVPLPEPVDLRAMSLLLRLITAKSLLACLSRIHRAADCRPASFAFTLARESPKVFR